MSSLQEHAVARADADNHVFPAGEVLVRHAPHSFPGAAEVFSLLAAAPSASFESCTPELELPPLTEDLKLVLATGLICKLCLHYDLLLPFRRSLSFFFLFLGGDNLAWNLSPLLENLGHQLGEVAAAVVKLAA